jgi:mRNA interferase MazF
MEILRRGDLVSAVLAGDYGKPRPVLIVQDDAFSTLRSLSVLPLTSDLRGGVSTRITVTPDPQNGLARQSHVMIDKIQTVTLTKIGYRIGAIDAPTMRTVSTALASFLGLGEN